MVRLLVSVTSREQPFRASCLQVLCLVTRTVLGNRLAGILHGCLTHHTAYSETIAWAHRTNPQITQAA
jgi:hypothetical protein